MNCACGHEHGLHNPETSACYYADGESSCDCACFTPAEIASKKDEARPIAAIGHGPLMLCVYAPTLADPIGRVTATWIGEARTVALAGGGYAIREWLTLAGNLLTVARMPCACGHAYALHAADSPHACAAGECACRTFTSTASRDAEAAIEAPGVQVQRFDLRNPEHFAHLAEMVTSAAIFELRRKDGELIAWIQERAGYCDRGRFHTGIEEPHHRSEADPWPRYYFDLGIAIAETEAYCAAKRIDTRGATWGVFAR